MLIHSLVFVQILLSAILVLSADWSPVPWAVIAVGLPGAALATWAWFRMGLTRLRIHPETTDDTVLINDGPYAFVRHPMYTGLLWFTAATLLSPPDALRIAAWFTLLVVLLLKTRIEEASLIRRFEEYRNYRTKVPRLFPGLPF